MSKCLRFGVYGSVVFTIFFSTWAWPICFDGARRKANAQKRESDSGRERQKEKKKPIEAHVEAPGRTLWSLTIVKNFSCNRQINFDTIFLLQNGFPAGRRRKFSFFVVPPGNGFLLTRRDFRSVSDHQLTQRTLVTVSNIGLYVRYGLSTPVRFSCSLRPIRSPTITDVSSSSPRVVRVVGRSSHKTNRPQFAESSVYIS